jgi:lysophospholipid hydrolase
MESLNTTTTTAAVSAALSTVVGAADGPNPALSSVITRANDVVVAHGSFSWIGLIARLILWTLQLLSTIIYLALKLTTISIPTLLFTLLSSSLTVTMNATTV